VIERALNKLQEILEDEVVTPDELEEVRKIVRAMDGVLHTNGIAVDRMVKLVDSLRTFGRPDRADIDRVDLHDGIEGTLAVLGHEIHDIEIVREYGDIPHVECYPDRINQVFMNLLLNALQAMGERGTLTVRSRSGAGQVSVAISDTGPGIAPNTLEMLFDPGFTTKGDRVGMGLGLAISRQIVDQHGGDIEVESVLGEGTTFIVYLPLDLTEAEA
jgi:signal transduction histidine kinase